MAEAEQKRSVILGPGGLKLAEQANNFWQAYAPDGCTPEDIENPIFWSVYSQKLRPFDGIRVIAEDGTWMANCIVIQSSRTETKVHVEKVIQLMQVETPDIKDPYYIKWAGPKKMWCLFRTEDGARIKEGMQTQEEAATYKSQKVKLR